MAALVEVWNQLTISDSGGVAQHHENRIRFAPGAGTTGKRETVSIAASAFTALSPPTSSKAVALILNGATGLTLKGVTGDGTGITLTPSSNPISMDCFIPLGSSPSIGLLSANASIQTIEVIWM